jgi:hypothetical protein
VNTADYIMPYCMAIRKSTVKQIRYSKEGILNGYFKMVTIISENSFHVVNKAHI